MSKPQSRNAKNNAFWADHYTAPLPSEMTAIPSVDHVEASQMLVKFSENFQRVFKDYYVPNSADK